METISLELTSNLRRETLHGRRYIVADASMIVPGVLNGSQGALYYPVDEVKKNPGIWNGVPVTVGHPYDLTGNNVSARDPKIEKQFRIGTVYNDRFENGKRKAEVWLDEELTKNKSPEIYKSASAGVPIELSTGLFTDNEQVENGKSPDGRPYDYVARNYRPDHLAILPNQTGACSLKDGCGLNVNCSCGGTCDKCKAKQSTTNSNTEVTSVTNEKRTLLSQLAAMLGFKVNPVSNTKKICDNDDDDGGDMTGNAWSDEARAAAAEAKSHGYKKTVTSADMGQGSGKFTMYKHSSGHGLRITSSGSWDHMPVKGSATSGKPGSIGAHLGKFHQTTNTDVTSVEPDADDMGGPSDGDEDNKKKKPTENGGPGSGPRPGGGDVKGAYYRGDVKGEHVKSHSFIKSKSGKVSGVKMMDHQDNVIAHETGKEKDMLDLGSHLRKTFQSKEKPTNNSSNGDDMDRNKLVSWLTTNCDCHKGKEKVLANQDNYSDEELRKLKLNAEKAMKNAQFVANASTDNPDEESDENDDDADTEQAETHDGKKGIKGPKPPVVKNMTLADFEKAMPASAKAIWNAAKEVEQAERSRLVSIITANMQDETRKEVLTNRLMNRDKTSLDEIRDLASAIPQRPTRNQFAPQPVANYFGSQPYQPTPTNNSGIDDILELPTINYADIAKSGDARTRV